MPNTEKKKKVATISQKKRIGLILRWILAVFLIAFSIFPVIWIISAAFNPVNDLATQQLIPENAGLIISLRWSTRIFPVLCLAVEFDQDFCPDNGSNTVTDDDGSLRLLKVPLQRPAGIAQSDPVGSELPKPISDCRVVLHQ